MLYDETLVVKIVPDRPLIVIFHQSHDASLMDASHASQRLAAGGVYLRMITTFRSGLVGSPNKPRFGTVSLDIILKRLSSKP